MLKVVIVASAFLIWSYSFYYNFVRGASSEVMIAYIGHEHARVFERAFDSHGYDLWTFGHRRRRGSSLRFDARGRVFDVFKTENYKHLLVLNRVMHIPPMFDSEVVVHYLHANETVATLWQRESDSPVNEEGIEEWLYKNDKSIEKIHI